MPNAMSFSLLFYSIWLILESFFIFSKIFIFNILINNFFVNDFFEKLLIMTPNELLKLGDSWLADHE